MDITGPSQNFFALSPQAEQPHFTTDFLSECLDSNIQHKFHDKLRRLGQLPVGKYKQRIVDREMISQVAVGVERRTDVF